MSISRQQFPEQVDSVDYPGPGWVTAIVPPTEMIGPGWSEPDYQSPAGDNVQFIPIELPGGPGAVPLDQTAVEFRDRARAALGRDPSPSELDQLLRIGQTQSIAPTLSRWAAIPEFTARAQVALGRQPSPEELEQLLSIGIDQGRTINPTLEEWALAPKANMSIFSSVVKSAVGFLPGGNLINAGLSLAGNALKPKTMAPAVTGAGLGLLRGGIPGAVTGLVGGAIPGLLSGLLPGSTPSSSNGSCGCHGKRKGPAPKASFFGGNCPCGTTLRRLGGGARDICIKSPRMNVFNPRALARADRRVTGFARRATPILRDLGFQVSKTRKGKIKVGKRRARR